MKQLHDESIDVNVITRTNNKIKATNNEFVRMQNSTYKVIRMLHWHGFKTMKLTPVQERLMSLSIAQEK